MKEIFKKVIIKILTLEAAWLLKRRQPKIIAITGSVGKTSTKDAIFSAIKNNLSARKSEKSFNSEIGVPLTVLGLPNAWSNPWLWIKNIIDGFFICLFSNQYPDILVLETGIDNRGDMEKLTKWLKPDLVVLTRLPKVPTHVEQFSSPEEVVAEKMKLVSALKTDGVLIYNHDDDIIKAQLPDVLQKQVGFGRYLDTDFTAKDDRVIYHDDRPVGVEFSITHQDKEHKIQIPNTIGTQHVYSVTAALAVANALGVDMEIACQSLKNITTPPGRMNLLEGIKSSIIIDDTYNSSPIACEQALLALKEVKYQSRKIAVLGDMLELGKYSSDEHKRIGSLVPESVDILITVGVRARGFADGALASGMSEKSILQYENVDRAGRELQNLIKAGDIILVKASQGVRLEKVVEEVMAEPEKAEQLLVRQDAAWKAKN
jgi:UDP-N-acetylmuramoyl-tripeptide--D-alanyl-D-alanine ligase